VVEKAGDGRLMVNAGTKKKPRWVVTHAKHASEPVKKQGIRNDNLRNYKESLTPAELKAIEDYQGENYKGINSTLRRGETPGPVIAKRIQGLDSAVSKGVLAADKTLYRSGNGWGNPGEMIGKTFTDHGFVSTSEGTTLPSRMAASRKDGVFARIKAPAGASVGYLGKVFNAQSTSKYGRVKENEILLPRGSTFKVTAARRNSEGTWIVDMELVI
jgi:hypothetical protein